MVGIALFAPDNNQRKGRAANRRPEAAQWKLNGREIKYKQFEESGPDPGTCRRPVQGPMPPPLPAG
jgi:hypothetical protein